MGAYFCVDDLELARAGRGLVGGAHEGDERRAEEHLDDAARAVVCGRGLVVSAAAVQDRTGQEGRGGARTRTHSLCRRGRRGRSL